jgi:ankyrin repeat protein
MEDDYEDEMENPRQTPLHDAVHTTLDEVKRLVEAGADVNARDAHQATPLIWAVAPGRTNLAILQYLVDHGADVNTKNAWDTTPLQLAAINGDAPAVERLLELGADETAVSQTNQTAEELARGKAKAVFAERARRKAERKVNAKGLAMVSVSKQLPYELTRKIGEALDAKPSRFTPQSAKGRKTRARKTKRRLTRRRK